MRNVFVLFLIIVNSLYAAEEPSRKGQVTINSIDQEPSSTIAGCINAISGAYLESSTDLVVPGAEPILLQRSHSSSHDTIENFDREMLPYGWYTNHMGRLWFSEYWDVIAGTKKVPLGTCKSRLDYGAVHEANFKKEKGLFCFKPTGNYYIRGLTNTGSGYIGASTNPNNLAIYFNPKSGACHSIDGSGTQRHYYRAKKSKTEPLYLLQYEKRPSGNTLHYSYDDHKRLSKIQAKNVEGKELSHISIQHQKSKDNPQTVVRSSDGRQTIYHHKTVGKRRYLKSVELSEGPNQSYHHKKGYEDYESLVGSHHSEDGNYRNIIYYWEKPDKRWLIPDEDRFRRKSYKLGRVHKISEPVGPAGQDKVTYEMHYNENITAGNGVTTVIDGLGRHTRYHYDKKKMLTTIQRINNPGKTSTERFFWEKEKLTAKFLRGDKKIYYSKIYKYDPKGNVLQDQLFGNLTGHCTTPLKVDGKGIPPKETKDRYTCNYTYSQNQYNLLLSKKDCWSKTTYTYRPKSNLKTGEFVWDKETIKLRKFFFYDENATLVKEITDDGSTQNFKDLTDVTMRRITCVIPRETAPIGFPQEVIEKYLEAGEEKQLKRIVNEHSPSGKLLYQAHYDSEDQLLYTQSWKYDNSGNVIEEIDPMGRLITRTYDIGNRPISQEGPIQGQYTSFTYDKAGRLIAQAVTDPDGNQFNTSFKYDAMGQKIESTDCFGQVTKYQYDHHGNCVREVSPAVPNAKGQLVSLASTTTYDAMGNPLSKTNPLGEVTTMEHTIRKQPSKIVFSDHTFEEKHYRPDGQLLKEVAKNGLVTKYTRDYQGRVTKKEIFSPQGEKLSESISQYNAFHLLTEIDEEGGETHYQYDGAGRLVKTIKGDDCLLQFYDSNNRPTRTSRNGEIIKCTEYDNYDRAIEEREEDAEGAVLMRIRYEYDQYGNQHKVTKECQAGVSVTERRFNSLKQPVWICDAEENETHIHYNYRHLNEHGQYVLQVTTTDPMGIQTIETKNTIGKTVSLVKKNSYGQELQRAHYLHDALGRVIRTIQTVIASKQAAYEIVNTLQYSVHGEVKRMVRAQGTPEQTIHLRTFNDYGQLEAIIKPDGNQLSHRYNDFGQLEDYADQFQTFHYRYFYNKKGAPIKVEDLVHHTSSTRRYDSHDHLISETLANGLTLNYGYTNSGSIQAIQLPDYSSVQYEYRGCHLKKVLRRNAQGEELYHHAYLNHDLSGKVTSMQLIKNAGVVSIDYDVMGRKRAIRSEHWSEEVTQYDSAGNLLECTKGDVRSSFQYDDLYQLIREDGSTKHTYSYDSVNNRVERDGVDNRHNHLNQLLSDSSGEYRYDLNGNMVEQKLSDKTLHLTYDGLDRLIEVFNGVETVVYQYDAQNRRILKKRGDESCAFLYVDQNEIGSVIDDQIVELRVLGSTPSAEIGASVAIELGEDLYAPLHDHNGNIVCLLDVETGVVAEEYCYGAFGEGVGGRSPWRFSSKRCDDETGFYYFGRRYYSVEMGRWLTSDPVGESAGPNLYAYVFNSPLTHFDLYGLLAEDAGKDPDCYGCYPKWYNPYGYYSDKVGSHLSTFTSPFNRFVANQSLREKFSTAGWMMRGHSVSCASEMARELHSRVVVFPGKRHDSCNVIFVPGIMTDFNQLCKNVESIQEKLGGVQVTAILNQTRGMIQDLERTVRHRLGMPSEVQELFTKVVKDFHEEDPTRTNVVIGHSQGGESVYYAAGRLEEKQQKTLAIGTFGSPRIVPFAVYREAKNYANTRDGVAAVAFDQFFTWDFRSKYKYKRYASVNTFWEHDFNGVVYQKCLSEFIDDLKENKIF